MIDQTKLVHSTLVWLFPVWLFPVWLLSMCCNSETPQNYDNNSYNTVSVEWNTIDTLNPLTTSISFCSDTEVIICKKCSEINIGGW
jgi:hypothetical protein